MQDIWDTVAVAKQSGQSLAAIPEVDPTQKYQGGNMGQYVIGLVYKELENLSG